MVGGTSGAAECRAHLCFSDFPGLCLPLCITVHQFENKTAMGLKNFTPMGDYILE